MPMPFDERQAITAIEHILYEICERRDAGDFEGMAELFAHATFRTIYPGVEGGDKGHGTQQGSAEVIDAFRGMVITYGGDPRTKYSTTNLRIEFDGDGLAATATSSYMVHQQVPADLDSGQGGYPLQTVSAGRYRDRFACVDGEWRLVERTITADLTGDRSRHMYRDPIDYGREFLNRR